MTEEMDEEQETMAGLMQIMAEMNEAMDQDLVETLLAVFNAQIEKHGTVNSMKLVATAAHFCANVIAGGIAQGIPADECEMMGENASDYVAFTTTLLIQKLTGADDEDGEENDGTA